MPCREVRRRQVQWRRAGKRAAVNLLALGAVLGVAGCSRNLGTFDSPKPAKSKLARLLSFGSKDEKKVGAEEAPAQGRRIYCPDVLILEGTAASRVYAGTPPSNTNLRYQTALGDTARECTLEGGQLALKIGVAGKVLLGPAGTAGSFSVPVRMAVLRKHDNHPLVSKLYRAAVSVSPGETQADFTIVSEPLQVPFIQDHTEDDYTIRVGIDEGGSPVAEKPAAKGGKR